MTRMPANIIWRQNPPPDFPPAGATRWGYDRCGLWAVLTIAGIDARMRWIAPGRFQMGSPERERERSDNETQHWVTLTQGYWLAESTCTQGLWEAVTGENPSYFKGANRPVDTVSWDDVQGFLQAVSEDNRLTLALPTEAQWEYACRAGTQTPFNLGETITPEQVNYDGNHPYGDATAGEYREETVDTLSFVPNDWGLYQMHGNVWEWCRDWYGEHSSVDETDPTGADTGGDRVLRGGSWIGHALHCRSASRGGIEPSRRFNFIGFRFAQVTPTPAGAERPSAGEAGQAEAPRSGNSRGLTE